MPHPDFVHQIVEELGVVEKGGGSWGKVQENNRWEEKSLYRVRLAWVCPCREPASWSCNICSAQRDGCLRAVPGAGDFLLHGLSGPHLWLSHPRHQKTCSLPATHVSQHQAVRSPHHALCWTLPGFPLLLPSQSWHYHLSPKNSPVAFTSHLSFHRGSLMDAMPIFLPKPADPSDCGGCVLPGSGLTEKVRGSP